MALFDRSGVLKKTKLYNIFDTVPERPVDRTDDLHFVLDGGSLIHRAVWPKQGTFGDVYTTCMSYIKKHYGDEIAAVFDGYTESSVNTKLIERQRRMMKRTSREIIFDETTNDADVHIVKTAVETYEKIKRQVVAISQDVDLLVLLTALTPDDMDILMLKEGEGKVKDRFYSSKDLQNSNLVMDYKSSILFLHAISGCDTTSWF
ncbi:hypothetical protein AVEN_183299-1 [Araneus ventricosus]|uniref:Uncharacterized protein n=1 Tax=Araneus ventricosus TaxID=182803 RepID=A0A4Y2ESS0_ARAVE|nr:hypothetical protein AVEN_183299-1 [Araneus ventricosus]